MDKLLMKSDFFEKKMLLNYTKKIRSLVVPLPNSNK